MNESLFPLRADRIGRVRKQAARSHQSSLRQAQRRLAAGARAARVSATARLSPECRAAAEQQLADALPVVRGFWEEYLRAGDLDSFSGFIPVGGELAGNSVRFQVVISDLGKAAGRKGQPMRRGRPSFAQVLRQLD